MTADLLALIEKDPAAGILAAAELRERRAKAATPSQWYAVSRATSLWDVEAVFDDEPEGIAVAAGDIGTGACVQEDAEHIAAEANPAHALAAVRRWRGVVERHRPAECVNVRCQEKRWCAGCDPDSAYFCRERPWPCPDVIETADDARAYLGASQ